MTGSANWSSSAFAIYDEDWLRFDGDFPLARAYQTEFNYIWDHAKDYLGATVATASLAFEAITAKDVVFTSANTTKNQNPGSFKWNSEGTAVVSRVVAELDSAQTSIKIAHAHFRTPLIFDALKRAHERGVAIKILLDQQEYRGGETRDEVIYFEEKLATLGLDVKYKVYSVKWNYRTAKQMHSKYTIIDDATVLTGSYNWSKNSETNTFENMVIVSKKEISQKYLANFEKLSGLRAGQIESLETGTEQSPDALSCHIEPMTMTGFQFDRWRAQFPDGTCR